MTRLRLVFSLLAIGGAFVLPFLSGPVAGSASVVTAVGGASIGLGVLLWIQQGLTAPTFPDAESPVSEPARRVGWRVDEALRASPTGSSVSEFRIRRILRRTLDTVLVERGGLSSEAAMERRRAGSWTDDPRAATFLGNTDVRPLSLRFRDWFVGDEFRANLRATVAEIDRLAIELDRQRRAEPMGERVDDEPVGDGPGAVARPDIESTAGAAVPTREERGQSSTATEDEVAR